MDASFRLLGLSGSHGKCHRGIGLPARLRGVAVGDVRGRHNSTPTVLLGPGKVNADYRQPSAVATRVLDLSRLSLIVRRHQPAHGVSIAIGIGVQLGVALFLQEHALT
jgi:hypothetical protein